MTFLNIELSLEPNNDLVQKQSFPEAEIQGLILVGKRVQQVMDCAWPMCEIRKINISVKGQGAGG